MKRMAQFFAVGLLLCVLAGCSNQPSVPANSPLSSASPSSEISPTPVLSPGVKNFSNACPNYQLQMKQGPVKIALTDQDQDKQNIFLFF